MKIYHQCGNNTKWNIESYIQDGIGDGLIFSPSDYKRNKIEELDINIKNKSYFDSQFYLPKSNKPKMSTYEFFPNTCLENQYRTKDYEEIAYENAYKCVQFQNSNNFEGIIIPSKYTEDYNERYLEELKNIYIIPFIESIKKLNINKKIYLTLILKDTYLANENITNEILNFATSFQNIDGIYLIPSHKETYKRIRDEGYLFNLMKFIDKLRQNDLLVHLGYTDIEGFLLSIADVSSISIGTYENTKCFDIGKFLKSEGVKQGPNPRIFSSILLQNIEYTYISSLKTLYNKYDELFEENKYKMEMFQPTFNWHFSKPAIYKNYFISYTNLLKQLPEEYDAKYKFVLEKLKIAMVYFKEINEKILLDEKSDGSHLPHWINAINMFNEYKKKLMEV